MHQFSFSIQLFIFAYINLKLSKIFREAQPQIRKQEGNDKKQIRTKSTKKKHILKEFDIENNISMYEKRNRTYSNNSTTLQQTTFRDVSLSLILNNKI